MIGSRYKGDPIARQVRRAEEEGWVYRGNMSTEGEVLELVHALVRLTKPEIVVETGTFEGLGTIAIKEALILNNKGHLWTVEKDVAEYPPQDRVTFVHADSTEWSPPRPIDFAFVDCGPPEVRIKALELLIPHLAEKNTVLVHDTDFYEDAFKEGLTKAYGRKPDIDLKALNGVIGWLP